MARAPALEDHRGSVCAVNREERGSEVRSHRSYGGDGAGQLELTDIGAATGTRPGLEVPLYGVGQLEQSR
jgi:hypothetical protein